MVNSLSSYKIGKVSKLTGISPDTLRVWERRYDIVIPTRSDSGDRLYSSDDVTRLKLMKNLVDGGDSIGNLAHLSNQELQARLEETQQILIENKPNTTTRLVIIGETLSSSIKAEIHDNDSIDLVAYYPNIKAPDSGINYPEADILVIEQSTLHFETVIQIINRINQFNVHHTIVIYRYASNDVINKLPRSTCSMMRSPVEPRTILQHSIALNTRQFASVTNNNNLVSDLTYAPPQYFNENMLAKIAALSPTINCECPHHLAELLAALYAFEKYSKECESRNVEDAELHIYLSKTTSQARFMIENVLRKLIEIEQLSF